MPPEADQTSSDPANRAMRVLVVEDEIIIAMDLAMQVEDAGHGVVGHAVNVKTCQELATQERPDVALMDMRLKGGDSGADAAAWLRNELEVPCIFISGNLDEGTRAALRKLNPIDFVGKPILPSMLRSALKLASDKIKLS